MEKSRLCGDVYDFSVSYCSVDNDDILYIHKYLRKKRYGRVFSGLLSVCTAGVFDKTALNSEGLIKCIFWSNRSCHARQQSSI